MSKPPPPPLPPPGARKRAKPKAATLVGRVLSDRYRIDDVIASGGMGTVYRGEHVHMQKRVAIKVLHSDAEGFPELRARFEREAVAGAHIEHRNVAAATDFGKLDDGAYFLVLEFVGGLMLHEILKRGPLPAARAARIARQIAAGLEACHDKGVVHRDLKPRNVMVVETRSDLVKIIDFGFSRVPLSRITQKVQGDDDDTRKNITLRGIVFGTVAYMAPETANGMDAVDERSDLYALGVILYEMLAGRHPFDGKDSTDLFLRQRTAPVPPIAQRAPSVDVPAALEDIARRLLEKSPADRFPDAAHVVEALDRALVELGEAFAFPIDVDATPMPGAHALPPRRPSSSGVSTPGATPSGSGPSGRPVLPPLPRPSEPGGSMSVRAPEWRERLRPWRARLLGGAAVMAVLALAALTLVRQEPRPTVGWAQAGLGRAAVPGPRLVEGIRRDDAIAAGRRALREARDNRDWRGVSAALVELGPLDPTTLLDRDLASAALAAAVRLEFEGDPKSDELFDALAGSHGAAGLDVLYDIAASKGGSRAATRASAILARDDVRGRAAVPLRIALELRDARCAAKADLFERASREGDARTLTLLERLRSAGSCSGAGQCCYWGDGRLEKAVADLKARLGRGAVTGR